jgi:hypothetical protein
MHIEVEPPLGEAELAALEVELRADARLEAGHPALASVWRRAAAWEAVGGEPDEDRSANERPHGP